MKSTRLQHANHNQADQAGCWLVCTVVADLVVFFIFYICANSISFSKFISKDLVFLLCYRKPLYTYKGLFLN